MGMTYADGIAEGFKRGYRQGVRDGWRKALLFFLKKQILRHEADNVITRLDVEKLEALGVRIAMKQQSRNKRTNRIIFAFGKHTTIAELAEANGLTYNTLYARIVKADMSPEDAILL